MLCGVYGSFEEPVSRLELYFIYGKGCWKKAISAGSAIQTDLSGALHDGQQFFYKTH